MNAASLGYTLSELEARGAQATAREILQQPALWREVGHTAAARRETTEAFLLPLLERKDMRIVLTGAGTSSFAGELLAPALGREFRRRIDAVPTTDIVTNPRESFGEDVPTLLVSFARSGDSPESVAASALAEQCLSEVYHLVVTCNSAGELHRYHSGKDRSLVLVMPEASNDQGFAMTSSFTCMVLATWLTFSRSIVSDELVNKLSAAAESVLTRFVAPLHALANKNYKRVVYLGSGPFAGLGQESALKLLELTAGDVVSYSNSSMGFRHGPKAILDEFTLVLVYLAGDPYTRQYDLDVVRELSSAMGTDRVVVISASGIDGLGEHNLWQIDGLDKLDDALVALPFVLCAQILGLQFSLALGKRPDNPFPSEMINRVVKGVSIYPLPGGVDPRSA